MKLHYVPGKLYVLEKTKLESLKPGGSAKSRNQAIPK